MTERSLEERILDFLNAHTVVSLAVTFDGEPHAASLMYAFDGLRLYWVSDPATRHSQALAGGAACAATIAAQFDDFRAIRGVQIHGTARAARDAAESAHGLGLLALRYPFLRGLAAAPEVLRRRLAAAQVYVLEPARITLIDNARGFGFKETLDVAR